jgi:hypothetical protein
LCHVLNLPRDKGRVLSRPVLVSLSQPIYQRLIVACLHLAVLYC